MHTSYTFSVASLWLYEPQSVLPTRILCPWDFCSKNTRVGFCAFLQGIFQTQRSNTSPALQVDSLPLSHRGSRMSLLVAQLLSRVRLFVTPYSCRTSGFPVLHHLLSLLNLMSTELVMPSKHLVLCHPLLLLPSVFPSIKVFSNWFSSSHQVTKVLELQLQHQSFQWIFRTDFL